MLNMQNVQNIMSKLWEEYANKCAEFVIKYVEWHAETMQHMQNYMLKICWKYVEICWRYAKNMHNNMQNMQNMQKKVCKTNMKKLCWTCKRKCKMFEMKGKMRYVTNMKTKTNMPNMWFKLR